MIRFFPLVCALLGASLTVACGELFDAKVSGFADNSNAPASNGNSTGGGTSTGNGNTTGNANNTGNSNNAAGGNTTGNGNSSSGGNTSGNGNTTGNGNTSTGGGGATDSRAAQYLSANGCSSASVTYAGGAQALVQTYCSGCHSGTYQPNLSNYAQAKPGFDTGGGLDAIASSPPTMPMGRTMAAADKCTLINWAAGGYAQ